MDLQEKLMETWKNWKKMLCLLLYLRKTLIETVLVGIAYSGLFSRGVYFANFEIAAICGIN